MPSASTRPTLHQRTKDRLRGWRTAREESRDAQVVPIYHDLAYAGETLGELYDQVEDENDRLDALAIASKIRRLTLNTLESGREAEANFLYEWWEWLEHRVHQAPMKPTANFEDILDKALEFVERPDGLNGIDLGQDFEGINASVIDTRSHAVYTCTENTRVDMTRGSRIASNWVDNRTFVNAVIDRGINNIHEGDVKNWDERVGGIIVFPSSEPSNTNV